MRCERNIYEEIETATIVLANRIVFLRIREYCKVRFYLDLFG